jgi:hypothetical protein
VEKGGSTGKRGSRRRVHVSLTIKLQVVHLEELTSCPFDVARTANDFMPFLLRCYCVRAACIKFSLRAFQVSSKTVVSSHYAVEDCAKGTVASLCYVSITSSRFLLGSHHECTTSYLRYVLATDFLNMLKILSRP